MPPALRPQTHPCFPCWGVGSLCAAPVTHQAQGSWTSRSRARRPPLARSVPQKTLGSLPWPIGYSVQIVWLPHGANFYRAHGRGVARLHNPVVGHLSRVETGTNQIGWMLPNFSPSLQPHPHGGAALSHKLSWHQRGRGPACCNSTPGRVCGPQSDALRSCCCYFWPVCVGKTAALCR
jgi:hypothetical protein